MVVTMSELATFLENAPAMDWLREASCATMDIGDFFVEAGHTISQDVLNVCRACPVREACVEHSYASSIAGGYFGGISPGQRRQMSLEDAKAFIERDPVQRPRRKRRSTPVTGQG
jgi:WhiB family redox-sensing transcriptional regulator